MKYDPKKLRAMVLAHLKESPATIPAIAFANEIPAPTLYDAILPLIGTQTIILTRTPDRYGNRIFILNDNPPPITDAKPKKRFLQAYSEEDGTKIYHGSPSKQCPITKEILYRLYNCPRTWESLRAIVGCDMDDALDALLSIGRVQKMEADGKYYRMVHGKATMAPPRKSTKV